jgi:hypothetical protein
LGGREPSRCLPGLADELEEILANGSPEQAKELLRLLVKEIRVYDHTNIVPTYRVPAEAAVRAIPSKVERAGIEPVTLLLAKPDTAFRRPTRVIRGFLTRAVMSRSVV